MNTTETLARLTATLNAKTEAALAQLASVEQQIAETIQRAEADASARLNAAVARLDATTVSSLQEFEARLATLTADAVSRAVEGLSARLDALQTQQKVDAHQEQVEASATPDIDSAEWLAEINRQLDAQAERDRATTPAVAAHAVEVEAVAVLDGREEAELTGDDLPTTSNPEGLHMREETGAGRAKYRPVEVPIPGEVYFLRDHRRHWNPVRFVGQM